MSRRSARRADGAPPACARVPQQLATGSRSGRIRAAPDSAARASRRSRGRPHPRDPARRRRRGAARTAARSACRPGPRPSCGTPPRPEPAKRRADAPPAGRDRRARHAGSPRSRGRACRPPPRDSRASRLPRSDAPSTRKVWSRSLPRSRRGSLEARESSAAIARDLVGAEAGRRGPRGRSSLA